MYKRTTSLVIAVFITLFSLGKASASIITFDLTAAPSGSSASFVADGVTATFSNATFNGMASSFEIDSDGIPIVDGLGGFGQGVDRFELVFNQDIRLLSYLVGFVEFPSAVAEFSIDGLSSIETDFVDEALTVFSNQFIVRAGETLVVAVTSPNPLISSELIQFRELTVESIAVSTPGTLLLMALAFAGLRTAVPHLPKSGS